jgi:hypothetical protein
MSAVKRGPTKRSAPTIPRERLPLEIYGSGPIDVESLGARIVEIDDLAREYKCTREEVIEQCRITPEEMEADRHELSRRSFAHSMKPVRRPTVEEQNALNEALKNYHKVAKSYDDGLPPHEKKAFSWPPDHQRRLNAASDSYQKALEAMPIRPVETAKGWSVLLRTGQWALRDLIRDLTDTMGDRDQRREIMVADELQRLLEVRRIMDGSEKPAGLEDIWTRNAAVQQLEHIRESWATSATSCHAVGEDLLHGYCGRNEILREGIAHDGPLLDVLTPRWDNLVSICEKALRFELFDYGRQEVTYRLIDQLIVPGINTERAAIQNEIPLPIPGIVDGVEAEALVREWGEEAIDGAWPKGTRKFVDGTFQVSDDVIFSSAECRSVSIRGELLPPFNLSMAASVRVMLRAYDGPHRFRHESEILEDVRTMLPLGAATQADRLRDVFKNSSRSMHPAWGQLVCSDDRRIRRYGLNLGQRTIADSQ